MSNYPDGGALGTPPPFRKPNLLHRLLGRPPKANAWVEVHRLLAERGIESTAPEEIAAIEQRYRVRLERDFAQPRRDLYAGFLERSRDPDTLELPKEAQQKATRLAELLQLTEPERTAVEQSVSKALLENLIQRLIADEELTEAEADLLRRAAENVGIEWEEAQRLYREYAAGYVQRHLNQAVVDQAFSPEEEAAFQRLCQRLRVEPTLSLEDQEKLQQYRLYWQIAAGNLPVVEPDIHLPRTERCHLIVPNVEWLETRRVTRSVRVSGPAVRIPLGKYVSYRVYHFQPSVRSEDVLTVLDHGTLYLTSRRLLFRGRRGNRQIPLNRIIDFTLYRDGIQIEKDAGKNPVLRVQNPSPLDLLARMLLSLLSRR
ncbi:MAG: hypothetical protein KatS3mg115_0358 [Candidatus Poribacteria bacterium]|nr:MAG: hypothetical protein KatS3mg115_0358 [Candidatus Poribacteria bacterium]